MATLWLDATNGNDANPGTLAQPKQHLDAVTEVARVAGDIIKCRGGMGANRYDDGTDLTFLSDGTIDNPITIEADYDNDNWPVGGQDHVNLAETYTLAFGTKALLASANPTAVVDQVVYESTEDNREFSYQVAAAQNLDNGTDDGADNTKLIDTGEFANTVLGTFVQNTTSAEEGYVSELVDNDTVEVTEDGRPSGKGGTIVQFANGDAWTIPDQIVLYLPYKGDIAAAGRTLTNMLTPPQWNTPAGNFQWNFDGDNYWKVQGIYICGTDGNGNVEIDSAQGHIFRDCIFEGVATNDYGVKVLDDIWVGGAYKCRFTALGIGIRSYPGDAGCQAEIVDCLFHDGIGTNVYAIYVYPHDSYELVTECEFRDWGNITGGSLTFYPSIGYGQTGDVPMRNNLYNTLAEIQGHAGITFVRPFSEDHNMVLGDNRQLSGWSVADDTPAIQSDTATLRPGGGTTSIKCTPSASLNSAWELSKVQLFEYPIQAAVGAHTYTIYYIGAGADFTVDPANTELWIEAEYWHSAAFNHRRIFKSVNVPVMDGTWNTLTVTVTCAQAGVLYLRGWYCKPKEGVPSNIFYTDHFVGIA